MNIKKALIVCLSVVFTSCKVNNKTLTNNEMTNLSISTNENVDYARQILEKYWKLTKLSGKEIMMEADQEREVYFILKSNENQIIGFSGCNHFSGSYSFEKGNKINVSKLVSTLKACPNLQFDEHEFFQIFKTPVSYSLKGDKLTIQAKDGSKAIFEAVYF